MLSNRLKSFSSGELDIWYEDNGGVFIRCNEPSGDPVELTEEDVTEIQQWLEQVLSNLQAS